MENYGFMIYAFGILTLTCLGVGGWWLYTNYKKLTPAQIQQKITEFILQYAEAIVVDVVKVAVKGEDQTKIIREVSDKVYDLLEGPNSPPLMTKLVRMFTKDEFYNKFKAIFEAQIKSHEMTK